MNGLVLSWTLLGAGLRLDAHGMHALALGGSDARSAALAILVLAGLSFSAGRLVVLLINGGSRTRLVGRSLLNAACLPLAIVLGSTTVTKSPVDPVVVAAFVAAPLTLSAFGIIPYVGLGLNRLLGVWTLMIVLNVVLSATSSAP